MVAITDFNADLMSARQRYNYHKQFDIVLACAFEECEHGETRFSFYEEIGNRVEKLGKRIFLPHKEIDLNWEQEKIYAVANEIVIPSAELTLAYLGLESLAAGVMIGSSYHHNVPMIYFYESGKALDRRLFFSRGILKQIPFESDEEAVSKIEESVKNFYA